MKYNTLEIVCKQSSFDIRSNKFNINLDGYIQVHPKANAYLTKIKQYCIDIEWKP